MANGQEQFKLTSRLTRTIDDVETDVLSEHEETHNPPTDSDKLREMFNSLREQVVADLEALS